MQLLFERQDGPPLSFTDEYIKESNSKVLVAVASICFAVPALIVLLRAYVRGVMIRSMGWDDYVIFATMIPTTLAYVSIMEEVKYGLGRHNLVLLAVPGQGNFTMIMKWIWWHSHFVIIGICMVKISIGLFLLRLSSVYYRRFLISMIVILLVFTLMGVLTLIFVCLPIKAAWDFSLRPPPLGTGTAKCYSNAAFTGLGLFNSAITILTDIIFATVPIPIVWNLQLKKQEKIILVWILSLGYFACACAIYKTIAQSTMLSNPDWMFKDEYFLWTNIELASGIIAASLPSLRPLVRLVLSGGTTVGSSGQTPGSHQSRSWSKKRNSSLGYVKTDNTGNISLNNFSRPTVRYKPTGESLDADSRYILSKEAQMSSASFEEPFPSRQRSTAQCAVGNSSPMTRETEFEDGRPHQIVRTTEVIIN